MGDAVPSDIMSAAVTACGDCLDNGKSIEWAAIYAIFSERERCALIAEKNGEIDLAREIRGSLLGPGYAALGK